MKLKESSLLLLIILIIARMFGAVSLSYTDLKMKLMPLIVSGLIVILSVFQLWNELTLNPSESSPNCEDREANKKETMGNISGLAWMAGTAIGILLAGFFISMTLFMFLYLKTHGQGSEV